MQEGYILGMQINTLDALPYPPAMLIGLAAGLEAPYDVAARYGYTRSKYDEIERTPAFRSALSKVQEVVAAHGVDAETVEHTVLQEMTARVTRQLFAKFTDPKTPLDMQVKLANTLYTREGALKQRLQPKAASAAGVGFSITIALPNEQSVTITADLPPGVQQERPPIEYRDTMDELDGSFQAAAST